MKITVRPVRVLCVFVLLLISVILHADKVILKNGDAISGKILANTIDSITIKTAYTTLRIEKSKIKHILYQKRQSREFVNLFMKNGFIIRGRLVKQDEYSMTIRLKSGERTVSKKMIKRVTWDEKLPGQDITPYLWRSALIPSWGQFNQGRTAKGVVIASVMGTLVTSTVIAKIRSQRALDDYYRLNTQSALDEANSRRKLFNTLLITTAGAWLLNVLDIIVFPPSNNNRILAFSPVLDPGSGAMAFSMHLKF